MWFIIHFYMLKYLQPAPVFHLFALLLYGFKCILNPLEKLSIASFCITCMYYGFNLYPSLIEFCFVPYYVISIYGFRNRDYYVFIGSILLGIHLYPLSLEQIFSHIIMNIGRSVPFKASHIDFFCAHLCLFLLNPLFKCDYVEIIAAISAFLVHFFPDNMDLFSACMMVNSMVLKVLPLHVLELDWYIYFKNNHFKRVYRSYNFILPLGVLSMAVVWKLYHFYT